MRCSLRRGARHKRSAQQTLNLEGSPSGGDNSKNLTPNGRPSVTHVSGTFCNPCLRAGPKRKWSGRVDLNHRPPGPEPHE
jgi:hypothetical protein